MEVNTKTLEQAIEQSTMISGLIAMTDKAIFQGINSENIDWLVTQSLNQNYEIDVDLDNAIEALKVNIRATADAHDTLHDLIVERLKKVKEQ